MSAITAIRRESWTIEGRLFDLSWPADMDALLDDPQTRQRFAQDEYMPYWAQPWPAGVILAEALLNRAPGAGKLAIEIGCGVGLVSIAAAYAGWSVIATDYDEQAIEFARMNAERSGVNFAGVRLLDYREPLAVPQFDLILGSDLVYERKKAEPVAQWIASALNPLGEALMSDPNRAAADGFVDALEAAGLAVRVEAKQTLSQAGLQIQGRIWRIAWPGVTHAA